MPDAKILIVDDHEETLYALESALAPLGYLIGRATNGDEALKQVLRGQVGLLLLDVRMPGVSGLEVVRYMRHVEQTQHIPVILLTGFGPDHELTSAAFRLGVADLVMKPVEPLSLRTKVRYLYDTHRRRLALEQEIRDLRALVKDHTEPGRTAPRRTALPHPDAHVPLPRTRQPHDQEREGEQEGEHEGERDAGLDGERAGELEQGRT